LASIGEKVVIDKKRAIYFIDNVKFHVDNVKGLGSFMEIEAIDRTDTLPLEKLHEQCWFFMDLLEIADADLIDVSYSDLLLAKKTD
jgi:adenylate cyclase class IV